MTAFAREEITFEAQQLTCEIRSVNHRYLDVNVYLPEPLRPFEMIVRDHIRQQVKRGKLDCNVRLQAANTEAAVFNLNHATLRALHTAHETIVSVLPETQPMTIRDVLQFPGVMHAATQDQQALKEQLLLLIDKAVANLVKQRAVEGNALLPLFQEKLASILQQLKMVREHLPEIIQVMREKLVSRFQEAAIQLNAERLEQEMVLFAQKIDVVEEIERAEAHVAAMSALLQTGGMVGRQLDFMLQELNREANTLGSKSAHLLTTNAALQMKILIEQIREQIQNIE
jgi:uncharacterized protein (TIGR00255 family)